MNHITDELLEKYENKILSDEETRYIFVHRAACSECDNMLRKSDMLGLRIADITQPALSENFNLKVMQTIYEHSRSRAQLQKMFNLVLGIFLSLIGSTLGLLIGLAMGMKNISGKSLFNIESYSGLIDKIASTTVQTTSTYFNQTTATGIIISMILVLLFLVADRLRFFKSRMVTH